VKCGKLKRRSNLLPLGKGWRYHSTISVMVGRITILKEKKMFVVKTIEGAEVVTVVQTL
jgi:hypothetical protein